MELNKVQLLVRDGAALNKFQTNHDIPDGVQIERPQPNEDANLVGGHGNRILIRIWLIHKAGLRFPISPLLKEVMARCRLTFMHVSVNFVRTELVMDTLTHQMKLPFNAEFVAHLYNGTAEEGAGHTLLGRVPGWDDNLWSFPRYNGRLPDNFNDRFKRRSKDCEAAIRAINDRQASRKITNVLEYEPFYWHVIPPKNEEFGRVLLPSLHIEGRAPQHDDLFTPFRVPSQGFGLLEGWLILDSSKEFVYRFLENHINPSPSPVLVIDHGVLPPSKLPFALGSRTRISFCLPDVVLQPGKHFMPGQCRCQLARCRCSSAVNLSVQIVSLVALCIKNLVEIPIEGSLTG
ncbi:hypothetical protein Acr_27g0004310 [Actinidia rufa]|uniref:Uncharacterized protein n=1 Tax=Actinidia rufa TaxID=165716 RepID=A0A7J0H6H6_9ERIC|nr:hypothetical protein Acr_27g0004310 [Actinidia rufa]